MRIGMERREEGKGDGEGRGGELCRVMGYEG